MDGAVGRPKEKRGTKPALEVALFAPSGAATLQWPLSQSAQDAWTAASLGHKRQKW